MYYAVQVLGQTERKVVQSIKDRIEPELYDAIFYPTREMNRKIHGVWTVRQELIFPGYIFIDTTHINDLSVSLIRLPEFAKVLGKDRIAHSFVPLSDEEARAIDILCDRDTDYVAKISEVEIKEGKIARVLSGPLMGNEGIIKKVNLHRRQVLVGIQLFNRTNDILLGIDFISLKR